MPLPAKNDQTTQKKPHPNADTVSDKALALKPPAQRSAGERTPELPLGGEYVMAPFQSTLQRKIHDNTPEHAIFSQHAGAEVAQRTLEVKDDDKDDTWVDGLDAATYSTVPHIGTVTFADVKALLKVWISLDREISYDNARAAVTAAVNDTRSSAAADFGDLTGAGFTATQCRNMYSILGGTLTDINTQYGGAYLKSLYDRINLNGVIVLHDKIGDADTFSELVVGEMDAAMVGYIGNMGAIQAGKMIAGSSIEKFRKLCVGITAAHAYDVGSYEGCYALMEWAPAELTALNTNWGRLGRLLAGEDAEDEVGQIDALRQLGPTMAEIAGFAAYPIFNAADLVDLFTWCNNVARLNGILATAVTGYGQTRQQVRDFLNANAHIVTLAGLESRLERRIKGRSPLTGAEIEKLHADGNATIAYVHTIQTAQEQIDGGGMHVFSITWGNVLRSHQIHIHYEKGQNRKTQNVAKHIKPSAFSDTRNPISHAFALALQATIP